MRHPPCSQYETYRELLAGEWSVVTWLALVGGPKRGQVTALQRALLYLAFGI